MSRLSRHKSIMNAAARAMVVAVPSLIIVIACSSPHDTQPSNGFKSHGMAILPANPVGPDKPDAVAAATATPTPPARTQEEVDASIALLDLNQHLFTDDELRMIPAELKAKVDLPALRSAMFEQINKDRVAFGLQPVAYDKVAEQAGDLQNWREATAAHMLGHYSLNGDLPYMRYAQAGGADGHAENWASGGINLGRWQTNMPDSDPTVARGKCPSLVFPAVTPDNIQESVTQLALRLHCNMLNEIPGHDGHRQTILDPADTAVGIGLAVGITNEDGHQGLRLYMTQEFTRKSLASIDPLPIAVSLGAPAPTVHATMKEGYSFEQMQLFFESRKPLTPEQAFAFDHYSLPDTFTLFLPKLPRGSFYTAETFRMYPDLQPTAAINGRDISVPLAFTHGPGVYTVSIWLKNLATGAETQGSSRSIFVVP